jgi:hypothetical protein
MCARARGDLASVFATARTLAVKGIQASDGGRMADTKRASRSTTQTTLVDVTADGAARGGLSRTARPARINLTATQGNTRRKI